MSDITNRYVVRCMTVGEFDPHWFANVLDDEDEEVDAVFEADTRADLLLKIAQSGGIVVRDATQDKPYDKTFTRLKFDKEDLIAWVNEHFGVGTKEGSYYYNLHRVKSSRMIDIDDMHEFDEDDSVMLVDFLIKKLSEQ